MYAAVWKRPFGGGQPFNILIFIGSAAVLFLRLMTVNRICIALAQGLNQKRFKIPCAF